MVDNLIGKVSENPVITLKTLKEQMHADLPEKSIIMLCLAVIGLVHWMTFDGGITRHIWELSHGSI